MQQLKRKGKTEKSLKTFEHSGMPQSSYEYKGLNSSAVNILNTIRCSVSKLGGIHVLHNTFSTWSSRDEIQPWLFSKNNMKNSIIINAALAFKSIFVCINHLVFPAAKAISRLSLCLTTILILLYAELFHQHSTPLCLQMKNNYFILHFQHIF